MAIVCGSADYNPDQTLQVDPGSGAPECISMLSTKGYRINGHINLFYIENGLEPVQSNQCVLVNLY